MSGVRPPREKAFDKYDLEGIVSAYFTQEEIKMLAERNLWPQFKPLEEFIVKAHEIATGHMKMSSFDRNMIMAFAAQHDTVLENATRAIHIGAPRVIDLFGDNVIKHPSNAIYKCAKLELLLFIALNVINILHERLKNQPRYEVAEEYQKADI